MQQKRISAVSITALKEALVAIYWYKWQLKNFLTATLRSRELVNRLDWSDANYKRNIVGALVDHLVSHEDEHQADLLLLMQEVTRVTDFSHLEKLEDGNEKARKAREAVSSLKAVFGTHQDMLDLKERAEQNRRIAREQMAQNKGIRDKLDVLKTEFHALVGATNPQKRGFALEKLVRDLFALYDLDPKASFRVTGEQIDGMFTFDSTDYLFEAKWQKNPVDIGDLDAFSGKVARKLDNTLGLFLSLNGFSQDAIRAHSTGRKLMILMDGSDLMAVLEERIDLVELLRRKRRHASQTGDIYLPVSKILAD